MRQILMSAFVLLAVAVDAAAQQAPPSPSVRGDSPAARLVPGTPVRLVTRSLHSATGELAALRERELVIALGGDLLVTVPYDSILRLEFRAGSRDYKGVGLAIGLGLGLGVGIVLFNDGFREHCQLRGAEELCRTTNVGAIVAIPAFALAGALGGRTIGGAFKSDRWERTEPERLRIGMTWSDGPGVAVSLGL